MIKIKTEKNGKDYLSDLFSVLSKNMSEANEYYAITNIVYKMYSYDIQLATDWTLELLNKYASKRFCVIDVDLDASINCFIDTLIVYLMRYHSLDKVIKLIDKNIKLYEVRFLLWNYLFGPDMKDNVFKRYFDELVSNKKYDEAYEIVSLVLKNQGYIPNDIFNATAFLNGIINSYTKNKNTIKKQALLDMLYSLVSLVPAVSDQAVLKSNFVEFI